MHSAGVNPLDSPTFAANLAALRTRQPALADRLARLTAPETAKLVAGRDGSPVVQLSSDERTIRWLGGSSMPSVSAPLAVEASARASANVFLAGVGTGYEPLVLARRLPRHCAVFAIEPDPFAVAFTLAVADYSQFIADGRVVILDGDPADSLFAFLCENPGCDCPTQLCPLPGLGSSDVAELTGKVQRAAASAMARRASEFDRLAAEVRSTPAQPRSAAPRVTVLSADPGQAVTFAGSLARAMSSLQWDHTVHVPDGPLRCSTLARLLALRRRPADIVLFLNSTPGSLFGCLPPSATAMSWFLETDAIPAGAVERIAEVPILLAASTVVRDRLLARGARPDAVRVLETGVDADVFHPLDGEHDAPADFDVAVLADGHDLSPAAIGLGLESHTRLWRRTEELIAVGAERFHPTEAESVLARAEKDTGVTLADTRHRQQFLRLLANVQGRTIVARAAVQALAARGLNVALWGAAWDRHASVSRFWRGPAPPPRERNAIFNAAGVVVLPFLDPTGLHHLLDALAAGSCAVIRRLPADEDLLVAHPQTQPVVSAVLRFASHAQMISQVCRSLRDKVPRNKLVQTLQRQVLSKHTVTHRLQEIASLWVPTPPDAVSPGA